MGGLPAQTNRICWPGSDLRLAPSSNPPSYSYGLLPAKLFPRICQRRIDLASARGAAVVRRTELPHKWRHASWPGNCVDPASPRGNAGRDPKTINLQDVKRPGSP